MTQLNKIKQCIDEFINSNPQVNLDSNVARFQLAQIIENCLESEDNLSDSECCGGDCHCN